MSFSDDDEEFLSADEDNLDPKDDETSRDIHSPCDSKEKSTTSTKDIDNELKNPIKHNEDIASHLTESKTTNDKKSCAKPSRNESIDTTDKETEISNADEEDKDREKNLRLARKFSAELAKSIQASAPQPVKGTPPIQIIKPTRNSNEDYSKTGLPPAPPPTPALSSSYSNSDDPPPSQFSWRVVPKSKQFQQKTTIISETTNQEAISESKPSDELEKKDKHVPTKPSSHVDVSPSTPTTIPKSDVKKVKSGKIKEIEVDNEIEDVVKEEPKTQKIDHQPQARFALDRLSESVSQSRTQNIFEKVVDDIKKVSLKTDQDEIIAPPSIQSITELGSTLGGWGWSGASRLIASASQVTSQVGSVLDTVVNVAQQTIQQPDESTSEQPISRPAGRKDKDD